MRIDVWNKMLSILSLTLSNPVIDLSHDIVRLEREKGQRKAGCNSMQEEQQAHPSSSSSYHWDGCGRVRGGISRGSGLKNSHHDGFGKVQVTPMIHCKRPAGWELKAPTPHKPHLCSQVLSQQFDIAQVKTWEFCF